MEAKNIGEKKWEAYKYCGRERTGLDLIYWIKKVQDLGCGEILLTSIDYEGMQKGFDIELVNSFCNIVKVPLIISGGCGKISDIEIIKSKFINVSVALASVLHYKKIKIQKIKELFR